MKAEPSAWLGKYLALFIEIRTPVVKLSGQSAEGFYVRLSVNQIMEAADIKRMIRLRRTYPKQLVSQNFQE